MTIWKNEINLDDVNDFNKNTLIEHLGIVVTQLTQEGLVGEMPIDHRTVQPFKILHGGASVVLAESLGSIGSNLLVNQNEFYVVGQSINASHMRSTTKGSVVAEASLLHLGRSSHIWDIKIRDQQNKLICISRLTMAVIRK